MSTFLLDPIGFRLDGRPFYGFSGGDGDDGGDGGDSDSDGDTGDGDGAAEKDPVKVLENTLTKVRQERKAAQDEFRPWKAALRELGFTSPEALKEALTKGAGAKGGADQQVDLEKERETVRSQVRHEANRELALARVEAKAQKMFADPEDAVNALRDSVDDLLGRDGKPDVKRIESELDDLLARKPHWGSEKREDIGFDGGARQSGSGGKVTMDGFLRDESRRKRGQ